MTNLDSYVEYSHVIPLPLQVHANISRLTDQSRLSSQSPVPTFYRQPHFQVTGNDESSRRALERVGKLQFLAYFAQGGEHLLAH